MILQDGLITIQPTDQTDGYAIQSINSTVNGTYALNGLLSGWVRAGAISDGSAWYVAS